MFHFQGGSFRWRTFLEGDSGVSTPPASGATRGRCCKKEREKLEHSTSLQNSPKLTNKFVNSSFLVMTEKISGGTPYAIPAFFTNMEGLDIQLKKKGMEAATGVQIPEQNLPGPWTQQAKQKKRNQKRNGNCNLGPGAQKAKRRKRNLKCSLGPGAQKSKKRKDK